MRKMTQILDVPFDALTMAEAVEKVMGFLADGKQQLYLHTQPGNRYGGAAGQRADEDPAGSGFGSA